MKKLKKIVVVGGGTAAWITISTLLYKIHKSKNIEIVCIDITQLRFVLHDELQKIKGIERTETFISLEEGFSRNVQVARGI